MSRRVTEEYFERIGRSSFSPRPVFGERGGGEGRIAFCGTFEGSFFRFLLSIALFKLVGIGSSTLAAEKLQFNRDIRPILAEACYHCHGPDSAKREADLRLDTKSGLFDSREQGSVVVPTDLAKSRLWQRIIETDLDEVMPPPEAKNQLTSVQKETLRRWIEEGGTWEAHWSFEPPKRPQVPAKVEFSSRFSPSPPTPRPEDGARGGRDVVGSNDDARGGRNGDHPIDRFVQANLVSKGLEPNPEADGLTLIRRVSLDVTGLPPSMDLLDRYEKQMVDGRLPRRAYDALLDELFALPAYGEHRAHYWLDAARYGDTHGMHIDSHRENWVYRDWVIDAFNRNLPFDQFTTEQLAGDLLPNPTRDQLVATGFHRCNMTTSEGGSIPAEVDAVYATDRVATTSTVWMGLTTACAQCHDHKFDAITQKDFYSLAAFFRNTTQLPLDGNVPAVEPVRVIPAAADEAKWQSLSQELGQIQSEKNKLLSPLAPSRVGGLAASENADFVSPLAPSSGRGAGGEGSAIDEGLVLHLPLAESAKPGSPLQARNEHGSIQATAAGSLKSISGPGESTGIEQVGDAIAKFDGLANFPKTQPFSVSAWIKVPKDGGFFSIANRTTWATDNQKETTAGHHTHGWQFDIMENVPVLYLYGNDTSDSITYRGFLSDPFTLNPEHWYHVAFTYDGKLDDQGVSLYVNGRIALREDISGKPQLPLAGELLGPIASKLSIGSSPDGQKFQRAGLRDLRIHSRVLMPDEILALSLEHEANSSDRLEGHHAAAAIAKNGQYRELAKREAAIQGQLLDIRRRGTVAYVMEEKPGPARTQILKRGQYDQPMGEVEADTPSALPPMSSKMPRNRLGLAHWLVSPEHPLTARVTVNRFWQEIFGHGLVRTAEDFGVMGENPSSPELLDWLAVEFRESGWDVKKLLRLILTSETYRQSATVNESKLKQDPDNRWLSRGPRFRMDAEMLRDFALAAGGLLNRQTGGKSVKPLQPSRIWESVAMDQSNTRIYVADPGESRYRRSLYIYWKRSAPPPNLEILNAPTRENCVVRRERTNTPLQALVCMNDPQWLEAAKHLAEQLISEKGASDIQRLNDMSRRILSRKLFPTEQTIAEATLIDYRRAFANDPKAAAGLLGGESNPDWAAWTFLCNQWMNLDEAISK